MPYPLGSLVFGVPLCSALQVAYGVIVTVALTPVIAPLTAVMLLSLLVQPLPVEP